MAFARLRKKHLAKHPKHNRDSHHGRERPSAQKGQAYSAARGALLASIYAEMDALPWLALPHEKHHKKKLVLTNPHNK